MTRLKEIVLPGSVAAFTAYLEEALGDNPMQDALVLGVDEGTPQVVAKRSSKVVVVDGDERKFTEVEPSQGEESIFGVVGRLEDLPIKSDSMELVVGRHVAHFVPSAAKETERVLREGGEAYLSVPIGFGRFTKGIVELRGVNIARTEPLSRSWNPLARGTVFVIKK